MSIFSSIFGSDNDRRLKGVEPIVAEINALEPEMEGLALEDFPKETDKLRKRLEAGESTDDILPRAYALVREAAKRTINQRHYDVQLTGGVILHQRGIAEMRTGEGKTLVATLPLYLNAISGKGAHLVTTNDYLARVGVTWMGQVYNLLGLSVAVINGQETSYIYDEAHTSKSDDEERDDTGSFKVAYDFLRPCTRSEAYQADITYGTNSEFGFDYLRDNIAVHKGQLVQRGFNFAIVDEVDSILIDESRTPLIISAPVSESESLYGTFSNIARSLKRDEDYTLDEKHKQVQVSESGIDKAEKALGVENIYTEGGVKYVHHLETAIKAESLFVREKDYVVKDGEVIIVDAFTGRLQPGRRWSEGLHQAIEAKEGVKVQQESRTMASITYQNFFKRYKLLSGMTGTAATSAEEFQKVYDLEVVAIPTHREVARIDHADLIYQNVEGKFKAIARNIKEINTTGQPILVGTISIERSELLSEFLKAEGVQHEVLNAKKHEQEGQVIADAGKKGAVTIATNMAGRGIDIKLGGAEASDAEYEEVKGLGGLYVIGTERHEARRIDDQLRGRAGRQGDPGTTQFYVSLDDDLMRIFGGDRIKSLMGTFGVADDEALQSRVVTNSLEGAQTRVEGMYFDSRKATLEYDNVLNTQRENIYDKRRKILTGEDDEVLELLDTYVENDTEAEKTLEGKKSELGEGFIKSVRTLMLQVIDMHWLEHLEAMDYMRRAVNLRAIGQRDPLVEYKREGLEMYKQMRESIRLNVLHLIPNLGGIKQQASANTGELKAVHDSAKLVGNQDQAASAKATAGKAAKKSEVGRNDPCPCGSGKKYKKCGLINAPEHKG